MAILRLLLMSFLALRLLGGDLAVLQVAAWTGMIVARTAEQGVVAAVSSTLDGEHPCAMCRALQSAREKEEQKPALPDNLVAKLKLKDVVPSADLIIARPLLLAAAPSAVPAASWMEPRNRTDAPPVPPPRNPLA